MLMSPPFTDELASVDLRFKSYSGGDASRGGVRAIVVPYDYTPIARDAAVLKPVATQWPLLGGFTGSSAKLTFDCPAPRLGRFARDTMPHSDLPNTLGTGSHTSGYTTSSQSPAAYAAQVQHIRDRILAGDLFQANLSREITVELPGATRADVLGFAERLLDQTQAPFGAIVQTPTQTIISASPERFFKVERFADGRLKVIAEPIKGTRPRDPDPVVDQRNADELLASEKDRAENVMIADLVRNDLSKVCTDGSITVERLCELRSFATVHHLVTTVSGILKHGLTAADAFDAGDVQLAEVCVTADQFGALGLDIGGGLGSVLHPEGHGAGAGAVFQAELTDMAGGAAVEDEIDVVLLEQPDLLGAVLGGFGKAHGGEQLAQLLDAFRRRGGVFDEFETVGTNGVVLLDHGHGVHPASSLLL